MTPLCQRNHNQTFTGRINTDGKGYPFSHKTHIIHGSIVTLKALHLVLYMHECYLVTRKDNTLSEESESDFNKRINNDGKGYPFSHKTHIIHGSIVTL